MTNDTEAARVAEIAGSLTKAQREALLAIVGQAYRSWPEERLAAMLEGLGKHGLRDLQDMALLGRDGTRYVLTPLGIAVRAHLLTKDQQNGR